MDKKLEELKKEYSEIKASEELKSKMENEFKKSNGRKNLKTALGTVAAVLIVFGVAVNASPSFACAMNDIPVVGDIVKVVTMGKYENVDNGFEITINTPQIQGLKNKDLEKQLNSEFKEQADCVKAIFEKDIEEFKKNNEGETGHEAIEYNFRIISDNDEHLVLDTYILRIAASGVEQHNFYTIDKNSGKLVVLSELFNKDADFITPISNFIKTEMERLNREEYGTFFIDGPGSFESIDENTNFYINDDGQLVICFDEYEFAAGVQGSHEFVIPDEVIKDIVK